MFFLIRLTSLFIITISFISPLFSAEKSVDKPASTKLGFIEQHKTDYFNAVRSLDSMIDKYRAFYEVDQQKRSIKVKKQLSNTDRGAILKGHKELDAIIVKMSKCSPGDHDYMEVKEKYLPLAKEMSHRFHTLVMQPLRISSLDTFDHVRKIGAPIALVMSAIIVILVLKKLGVLPASFCCNTKTLFIVGTLVAGAGILYNYREQIKHLFGKQGNDLFQLLALDNNSIDKGTDFGLLIQKANEIKPTDKKDVGMTAVAQEIIKVAQTPA